MKRLHNHRRANDAGIHVRFPLGVSRCYANWGATPSLTFSLISAYSHGGILLLLDVGLASLLCLDANRVETSRQGGFPCYEKCSAS